MTAPELDLDVLDVPADTWAPAPLRWSKVLAGDVFLDRAGAPWSVTTIGPNARGSISVVAVRADQVLGRDVSPTDAVRVLLPLLDRTAILTAREQLGAVLIERIAS